MKRNLETKAHIHLNITWTTIQGIEQEKRGKRKKHQSKNNSNGSPAFIWHVEYIYMQNAKICLKFNNNNNRDRTQCASPEEPKSKDEDQPNPKRNETKRNEQKHFV